MQVPDLKSGEPKARKTVAWADDNSVISAPETP